MLIIKLTVMWIWKHILAWNNINDLTSCINIICINSFDNSQFLQFCKKFISGCTILIRSIYRIMVFFIETRNDILLIDLSNLISEYSNKLRKIDANTINILDFRSIYFDVSFFVISCRHVRYEFLCSKFLLFYHFL